MGDWRDILQEARRRAAAKAPAPATVPDPARDAEYRDLAYRLSAGDSAGPLEQAQDLVSGVAGGLAQVPLDILYAAGSVTGSDTLKKASVSGSQAVQRAVPPSNPYRETAGGAAGGFIGGVAPILASGPLSKILSIPRWAATAGTFASSGYGSGARMAEESGAPLSQQVAAGLGHAAIGAGMAFPAEKILGQGSRSFLETLPGSMAANVGYAGAGSVAGNLVNKGTFDPEADPLHGTGMAVLGATLGTPPIHGVSRLLRPKPPVPREPEQGPLRMDRPLPGSQLGVVEPLQLTERVGAYHPKDAPDPQRKMWEAVRKDMGYDGTLGSDRVEFHAPETAFETQLSMMPKAGSGAEVVFIRRTAEGLEGRKRLKMAGAYWSDPATGKKYILIDSANRSSLVNRKAVFWHEVIHWADEAQGQKVEKLFDMLSDQTSFRAQMKKVMADALRLRPEEITPELLRQEGVNYQAEALAGYLDGFINHPTEFRRLLESKPSLITRLKDAVLKAIQSMGMLKDVRSFEEKGLLNKVQELASLSPYEQTLDPRDALKQAGLIHDLLNDFFSAQKPSTVEAKPTPPTPIRPTPAPAAPATAPAPAKATAPTTQPPKPPKPPKKPAAASKPKAAPAAQDTAKPVQTSPAKPEPAAEKPSWKNGEVFTDENGTEFEYLGEADQPGVLALRNRSTGEVEFVNADDLPDPVETPAPGPIAPQEEEAPSKRAPVAPEPEPAPTAAEPTIAELAKEGKHPWDKRTAEAEVEPTAAAKPKPASAARKAPGARVYTDGDTLQGKAGASPNVRLVVRSVEPRHVVVDRVAGGKVVAEGVRMAKSVLTRNWEPAVERPAEEAPSQTVAAEPAPEKKLSVEESDRAEIEQATQTTQVEVQTRGSAKKIVGEEQRSPERVEDDSTEELIPAKLPGPDGSEVTPRPAILKHFNDELQAARTAGEAGSHSQDYLRAAKVKAALSEHLLANVFEGEYAASVKGGFRADAKEIATFLFSERMSKLGVKQLEQVGEEAFTKAHLESPMKAYTDLVTQTLNGMLTAKLLKAETRSGTTFYMSPDTARTEGAGRSQIGRKAVEEPSSEEAMQQVQDAALDMIEKARADMAVSPEEASQLTADIILAETPREVAKALDSARKKYRFSEGLADEEYQLRFSRSFLGDRYQINAVAKGKARAAMDDLYWGFHRMFLEEHDPTIRTVRSVQAQGGRRTPESDVETALTTYAGRLSERDKALRHDFWKPMAEVFKSTGIDPYEDTDSLPSGELFLYALHAEARNALHERRSPSKKWDQSKNPGSGMSKATADAIIAKALSSPQAEGYRELQRLNRAMNAHAMEYRVKYDLLSQEEADKWVSDFGPDYVPLKTEFDPEEHHGFGSGFDVRGRESRKSKGRKSRAESLLAHNFSQVSDVFRRGERNRVALALANFVSQNPDKKLWKLVSWDKHMSENEVRRSVGYKHRGRQRWMVFTDPDIADAMGRLSVYKTDLITQTLGKLTRAYSRLNTTWNPEFLVPNWLRDIQAAGLNMTADGRADIAKRLPADSWHAARAMWRVLGDPKASGKWEDTARLFRDHGGETGWVSAQDVATLQHDLVRDITRFRSKAYSPGRLFTILKSAGEVMERANGALENGTRLVVFKAALDGGKTPAEAAAIAKRVTVDFNRKGTATPLMNALFVFFNANIQGTARTLQGIHRNHRKQAVAAAMMSLGYMLSSLNRYVLSDRDEDGVLFWDKKSDWEKGRELVLMIPGGKGKSINIPLPWGWGMFQLLGTQADSAVHTGRKKTELLGEAFRGIVESVNPTPSPTFMQFISPTLFDPFVQIAENVDYAGRPVAPPHDPFARPPKPEYQRAFSTVTPEAKAMAKWLNDVSGGNLVEPGAVNVSPEHLELLAGQIAGGLGAFSSRAYADLSGVLRGKETTVSRLPVLRRFQRTVEPEKQDRADFYRHLGEVDLASAKRKELGDTTAGSSPAARMAPQAKVAQRRLALLRKQLDSATTDAQRDRVQGQIESVMRKFNISYTKTAGYWNR